MLHSWQTHQEIYKAMRGRAQTKAIGWFNGELWCASCDAGLQAETIDFLHM